MPFPSAVSGMVSRALEEVLRTSTLLGWDSSAADIPEEETLPTKPATLFLDTSISGRTSNQSAARWGKETPP